MILSTTHSRNRGFTVAELLIVIVVIAILATIAVVSYNSIQPRAHAAATASNLNAYVDALDAYELDHNAYPRESGCIGTVDNADNSCNTMTVTGASCADNGINTGSHVITEPSSEFNEELKPYLGGTIPAQPQTNPITYTSIEIPGCQILSTSSGPYYTPLRHLTLRADGTYTYGLVTSSQQRVTTYRISHHLEGEHADCYLPNSYALYNSVSDITVCSIFAGDVTIED